MQKKMKKYFLISGLILSFLLLPSVLLAQMSPAVGCTASHPELSDYTTGCRGACTFATDTNCAVCCLMNAILTLKDWVFTAAIIVATLMVIVGAFTITTAGGDPNKVNTGRNYILYAMVGYALALLSGAIPALAKGLMNLT